MVVTCINSQDDDYDEEEGFREEDAEEGEEDEDEMEGYEEEEVVEEEDDEEGDEVEEVYEEDMQGEDYTVSTTVQLSIRQHRKVIRYLFTAKPYPFSCAEPF